MDIKDKFDKVKDDILIGEITKTRNTLSTDRLDMSYGELMNLYKRGDLIISPNFQRLFRWDNTRKTRFIESILLGIPIPPIFVAEDDDGKWELVDGLQRISTILSFFGDLESIPDKNYWTLESGSLIPSLEDYNIKTLPRKYIRNIERTYCRVEIIKWDSDYDMRYELFNRLNTGGESLTPQEIRNCIFRGKTNKFNDMLKNLANKEEFLRIIELSNSQIERLYNEELVLRFVSLFKGNLTSKNSKNMSMYMTEYMKEVVNTEDYDYKNIESIFDRILIVLKQTDSNDYKFSNHQFSTSLFDAIFVGVAENIEMYEGDKDGTLLRYNIAKLKNDNFFRKYTGSAASSKSRVVNRMKEAKRVMANDSI